MSIEATINGVLWYYDAKMGIIFDNSVTNPQTIIFYIDPPSLLAFINPVKTNCTLMSLYVLHLIWTKSESIKKTTKCYALTKAGLN